MPMIDARNKKLLIACAALWASAEAFAWVYPEHRDLALMAAQQLDAPRKATFDQLWQSARVGSEGQLCEAGADADQQLAPACIDWAALSAIASDHPVRARRCSRRRAHRPGSWPWRTWPPS